MITLNRRRTMGKKNLPYDAEIEYLESTGTQWINSGVYGDLETESEMKFSFSSTAVQVGCCVFGTRKSALEKSYVALLGRGDLRLNVDILDYTISRCNYLPIAENVIYTIHIDKYVRSISSNGKIISSNHTTINTPFTTERTLKIGYTDPSCNWFDLTDNMKGKVYNCYIKKNGVLVRNLIPVRIGNVGYMYDKVSKQLFGNSGTGSFVLGNDI